MKKNLKILTGSINLLYKILPFFIGMYCYYPIFIKQDDRIYPFLDTIYASFMLYSGSTESGVPVGALLQLARFMALVATLSILISAFDRMNDLINRIRLCNADSTVVYGDSSYADHIYKCLNRRAAVRGREKFTDHASRYLIMFSDDVRNLEFYNRNFNALKDKNVYIMLDGVSRQNIENPRITVFGIAENCARKYWRDYPVTRDEKIAIIGFGNVGKNILLYGLQVNLIDPMQHFEYHIYGDGTEFRREHTELDKMTPDGIIFHDDGVYAFADMTEFDRIILCDDVSGNSNITALSRLFVSAPIERRVYIYAPSGDIVTNLFGNERVICFGTAAEVASVDMIIHEESMEAARKQHEFYCMKYGGTPWEKLDSFKRYSNVSSSDYRHVIDRLLKEGVSLEKVTELEHIRWCRYHYIHNWKYGPDTDSARRIHNCLVPFEKLSEEEKLKDLEAIKSRNG